MYVDGHLPGRYGITHKMSALASLQFSATSVIRDVGCCMTLDLKMAGDRVYVLGLTRDELGASEYYDMLGYTGCNVPEVAPDRFAADVPRPGQGPSKKGWCLGSRHLPRAVSGVHLAMKAMAGGLGLQIDLGGRSRGPSGCREDRVLYSESAGRFIVTIDPRHKAAFEALFTAMPLACVGKVTQRAAIDECAASSGQDCMCDLTVPDLKAAWLKPFGDLI
jgi:phosphoribosylformylglycinamidine (FGAM) synthase-like enzyme